MGELLSILSDEIINKYEGYHDQVYNGTNGDDNISGARFEVFDDVLSHDNYK